MSSKKTPNLELHEWVPDDYVQMEEFNENFRKLDENVGGLANIAEEVNLKVEEVAEKLSGDILNISQETSNEIGKVTQQMNDISINVKSFGAIGDGVTFDSNAIQNAINSLDRHKGGKVTLPANAVWLFDKPVVIAKDNVTIEGNGSTIIMADMGGFKAFDTVTYPHIMNNRNARCVFIADGAPEYVPIEGNNYSPECYNHKLNNLTIKDFTIQCGTGDGNFMGISIGLVDNLLIENVNVLNSKGNGIEVKKCVSPVIYNCDFINTKAFSLFLYKVKNPVVEKCYFKDAQNWVLEIKHSYNAEMWVNAYVNNNVFENIKPTVSDPVCIRGGGGYDSHGGTGTDPDGFNHRFVFGCTITNNTFLNCNAVAIQPTLHSGRWVIKNNKIINQKTAAIKVEGSKSLEYYSLTGGHIIDGNIIEFIDAVIPTITNAGIAVTSSNCLVINNEIRKSLYRDGIYATDTENVTIKNNKFIGSVYPSNFTPYMIRAINVKGLHIEGNKTENIKTNTIGDLTAILLNGAEDFEVLSNFLTGITYITSGNKSWGNAVVLAGITANGIIANNLIKYATTGIKDDGDINPKTNVLIRDNIITESRTLNDNYKITYSKFTVMGGTTANRPEIPFTGMQYFDITLGGKIIVFNGTTWVNVDGTPL